MSLPQIAQLEWATQNIAAQEQADNVHRTLAWDFIAGDFVLQDGKTIVLTEMEYVKGWIQKMLRTVKNSFLYEGTEYGSEHHALIGRNFHPDFSRAEYERMIREALLKNDAITQVDEFAFAQDGERLNIRFMVKSIFGTVNEEVIV